MNEALRLDKISKIFNQRAGKSLAILGGADLTVEAGETVALVAPSGAGKSTLLHIAGLLDAPTSGRVTISGTDATDLDDRARTRLRRETIGFVYQFHHLLPEFSALENVTLPQRAAGRSRVEAEDRARALLDQVGLDLRLDHRPAELSGGEQQRVAFARALANRPKLLLADEPTGNLDPETSDRVFEVLMSLVRNEGLAAVIATHNLELAGRLGRILELQGGRLIPKGRQ